MEHKFNIELACLYGIEESIIIDNIYFWIKKNVANEKHFYDGRYWTYNTAKAFGCIFPYLTQTKVYRILSKLEDENVIIKAKYNIDKYIQTNWFSFTDDALLVLKEKGYDVSGISLQFAKMQNGNSENAKCNTDNKKTDKKTEIDKSISKKADELFEICWLAYRRKGSKKKSKEYWDKLNDEEKKVVLPHIKAYVSTRELSYQKDFERYLRDKIFMTIVFSKNIVVYDPTKKENGWKYIPVESPFLFWNENHQCYIYIGGFYDEQISDGYDDEDRPNGATIMLNNGRGTIVWDATTKKWSKKAI